MYDLGFQGLRFEGLGFEAQGDFISGLEKETIRGVLCGLSRSILTKSS